MASSLVSIPLVTVFVKEDGSILESQGQGDNVANIQRPSSLLKTVLCGREVVQLYYSINENLGNTDLDIGTSSTSRREVMLDSLVQIALVKHLDLQPGLKTLRVGSGMGFLNTLIGFELGINGVNHGVEWNKRLFDISNILVNNFQKRSTAIDIGHFCSPVFVYGNVLDLPRQSFYDRLYCDSRLSSGQLDKLHPLIKVGGMLMFLKCNIMYKFKKVNEGKIECIQGIFLNSVMHNISLVPERPEPISEFLIFPKTNQPPSLKNLCRFVIREEARNYIIQKESLLLTDIVKERDRKQNSFSKWLKDIIDSLHSDNMPCLPVQIKHFLNYEL